MHRTKNCRFCKKSTCTIWCLHEIDRRLVAAGWKPISPWWWIVIYAAAALPLIRNIVLRGGRRGRKSTTLCVVAVSEILNDEKHILPPGDIAYFAIISASLPQAKDRIQTCGRVLSVLEVPHKQTAEQIVLADRNAGIRVFAATLKGVVSFTALGVLCDEVARWQDPDTGANPATEVLSSLRPTMMTMKSAQMWLVSSPWSTLDVHHKMFKDGNTKAQRVFHGSTWEMNPDVSEAETHALEPDFASWQREYAAVPMASDEAKFFPASFIDMATAYTTIPFGESKIVAGADFAFRRNSSALVTLRECKGNVTLTASEERIPGEKHLVPSETITDLAGIARMNGAESIACDLHYIETVRETIEDLDMGLMEFPTSNEEISKAYVRTRILLSERRLDLSLANPRLIEQLKDTTARPTASGGLTITNKIKGDSHGDLVSALVCAVWALDRELPGEKIAVGQRRFSRSTDSQGILSDMPTEQDLG